MASTAHLGRQLTIACLVLLLVSLTAIAGCGEEASVEQADDDRELRTTPGRLDMRDAVSAFEVSVMASQDSYPEGSDVVLIATGHDWPDALGGSALAGVLGGPILFASTNTLPAIVADEIERLGATRAVVLGGDAALGLNIDDELRRLGLSVERIAGAGRYETAERVARRVIEVLGDDYDGTAFVATGGSYADAVAVAPVAAARGWPVYLAHPTGGIVTYSENAYDGVESTIVLGGVNAVHAGAEAHLRNDFSVLRIAGQNRYHTSVMIAEYGIEEAGLSWARLGMATGEDFPDALAGGVLQGRIGGVMLLTNPDVLDAHTSAALDVYGDQIVDVTFFGGADAISQEVRAAVMQALE